MLNEPIPDTQPVASYRLCRLWSFSLFEMQDTPITAVRNGPSGLISADFPSLQRLCARNPSWQSLKTLLSESETTRRNESIGIVSVSLIDRISLIRIRACFYAFIPLDSPTPVPTISGRLWSSSSHASTTDIASLAGTTRRPLARGSP